MARKRIAPIAATIPLPVPPGPSATSTLSSPSPAADASLLTPTERLAEFGRLFASVIARRAVRRAPSPTSLNPVDDKNATGDLSYVPPVPGGRGAGPEKAQAG
jgi:hypothetical protein